MTWPTKDDFVDGDVLTAAQVNNIADNLNLFDPTLATVGQAWLADGAGSGAYGTVGGGMTVITTGSLAGQTAVTLSAIPQTYKHLQLTIYDVYGPTNGNQLRVSANGNNTVEGVGLLVVSTASTTAVTAATASATGSTITNMTYMGTSSSVRNQWVFTYYNYTVTPSGTAGWHMARCDAVSGTASGSSQLTVGTSVGQIKEEAPITSIVMTGISLGAGNTISAGTYILWGIS